MGFIEASSATVALEGPEFEPVRPKPHGMLKQRPSDTPSRQGRFDVKLIDPLVVQHKQRNDFGPAISEPDLAGRKDYRLEPPVNFFIGVHGRRNRMNRILS